MRDLLVTLIVFGSLPLIFRRPPFGVVMWIWISVMNPHSQGWGFAGSFPFAAGHAVALRLLVARQLKDQTKQQPVTIVPLSELVST